MNAVVAVNEVDYSVALEVASHEAVIRQAYKDSVGIWTWSVGLTGATGHDVERYIDNPASLQHCLNIFVWALRNYAAQVNDAFPGSRSDHGAIRRRRLFPLEHWGDRQGFLGKALECRRSRRRAGGDHELGYATGAQGPARKRAGSIFRRRLVERRHNGGIHSAHFSAHAGLVEPPGASMLQWSFAPPSPSRLKLFRTVRRSRIQRSPCRHSPLAMSLKAYPPGEYSPELEQLQRVLQDEYPEVGPTDGLPGSRTFGALSAFRFDNGLPQTDSLVITDDDRLALFADLPRPPSTARVTVTARDLAKGGSRTIKTANQATRAVGTGGLFGIIGTISQTVSNAAQPVTEAVNAIQPAIDAGTEAVTGFQRLVGAVGDFWWILAIPIVGFALWQLWKNKQARVDDQRRGIHA